MYNKGANQQRDHVTNKEGQPIFNRQRKDLHGKMKLEKGFGTAVPLYPIQP